MTVGLMLALPLQRATDGRFGVGEGPGDAMALMPVVAGIVLAVGLMAAIGPARRALEVQPTEALREE